MSVGGHRRRTRGCALVLSLALLAGVRSARAQTACRERDVEAELTRAMDHRQHSRESEAFAILQALWERCPSPRVRAQMALAEQGLGRWEDAYGHLREAMRNDLDPWIRARQEPLARALEIIRGHLARVEVSADVAGAELALDGERVGVLPLPEPLVVPRGRARLRVSAAGHRAVERVVTVAAGQVAREAFALEPEPLSARRESPRAATRAEPSAGASPAWAVFGWSAVGVGAVLGALGAWQAVAWSTQGDEAAGATPASPGELGAWARFHESVNAEGRLGAAEVCALADGSAAPDGAQVRSLCAENASRAGLAWGLGLGGAALVTAGVVVLATAPRGARRASVRATPWLGATLRGASVAVDF